MVIISPIIGSAVAQYSDQWTLAHIVIMSVIGMTLSAGIHRIYMLTPFPDSLAWRKGISTAGWMHFIYMGFAFTIIGLLYFCTESVDPGFLATASFLLTVYIAIGNHVLLGVLNEYFRFPWCPSFIRKPDPWITIAVTTFLLLTVTLWR